MPCCNFLIFYGTHTRLYVAHTWAIYIVSAVAYDAHVIGYNTYIVRLFILWRRGVGDFLQDVAKVY